MLKSDFFLLKFISNVFVCLLVFPLRLSKHILFVAYIFLAPVVFLIFRLIFSSHCSFCHCCFLPVLIACIICLFVFQAMREIFRRQTLKSTKKREDKEQCERRLSKKKKIWKTNEPTPLGKRHIFEKTFQVK